MRHWLKRFFLLFTTACITLSGCSSGNNPSPQGNDPSNSNANAAMGRYIETELSLPENVGNIISLVEKKDAALEIIYNLDDTMIGPWYLATSSDQGKTWSEQTPAWLKEIEQSNIQNIGYSSDDSMLVQYSLYSDEMWEIIRNPEKRASLAGYHEDDEVTDMEFPSTVILRVDAQGNTTNIDKSLLVPESNLPINGKIVLLENGDIVAGSYFDIVQFDGTTLEAKNTFSLQGYPQNPDFICQGDTLFVAAGDKILLYSLTTGEQTGEIADTQPAPAQTEDSFTVTYNNSSPTKLLSTSADGNSIFYADTTGIYREVVGGNISEKIVDGTLSSFNMPSLTCKWFYALKGDSFLALFKEDDNYTLMSYAYSPDVPTIPNTELKVYSLQDNTTIRQAMTLFQRKNPDVYINYTVANSSAGAVSTSDLLRSLSTELLAGKGPDILVLDGMSIDSYIEKDVLLDLNSLLGESIAQGDYFGNIAKTYEKENKLYAIPARFSVPMLLATDSLSNIDDFSTFMDAAAKEKDANREQYEDISPIVLPARYISTFYPVCAPAWFQEDGSLKKEELSNFLSAIQKVATADADIPVTKALKGEEAAWGGLTWAYNHCGFVAGEILSTMNLSYWDAAIQEKKSGKITLLPGQVKNVYQPTSIVGINKNTTQTQLAQEFITLLLSNDVQKNNFEDGLPVNSTSLENAFNSPYKSFDDGMSIGTTNDDDVTEYLNITWFSDETISQLKQMIYSLDTPSLTDQLVLQSIIDESKDYFAGDRSLEDVVNSVAQKVDMYLSE